jgi:hypothetical protein
VQHGLAAADGEWVTDLVEQHGLRIIVGGQVHTVLNWLSALPDTLIRARPMLCTIHALALLFTNYPHCRLPISLHVFFIFLMRFAFLRSSLRVHMWLYRWLHLWLHEVIV